MRRKTEWTETPPPTGGGELTDADLDQVVGGLHRPWGIADSAVHAATEAESALRLSGPQHVTTGS